MDEINHSESLKPCKEGRIQSMYGYKEGRSEGRSKRIGKKAMIGKSNKGRNMPI